MVKRSYSELILIPSFGDRLEYLKVREDPYNSPRHLSSGLYKSKRWLQTRDAVMKRDFGFDLGVWGVDILDRVVDGKILPGIAIVHHMNPVTEDQLERMDDCLFDPEFLITTSLNTHNEIHYKKKSVDYVEREPGDTMLWGRTN